MTHISDAWFDASAAAQGIVFTDTNQSIGRNYSDPHHKAAYVHRGFASGSGSYYIRFRILNRGPNAQLTIGISDGMTSCTEESWPGKTCSGCSLRVHDGHRSYSGTSALYAAEATTARDIAMLYNSDRKMPSFVVDGVHKGVVAGPDILKADTYYPVVTLTHNDQRVEIIDP